MSNAHLRVIALGNLAGELKTSLESAARTVGLELLLTREPARAFVELERDGALAVLVDMATLGAEQFCKRARGTERLRSVPVIGMSRHPNELGFARVFAWGADDLVPLGARLPLERRLAVLRDTPRPDASGFGQAVVAEATTQRRALVGRVLAQAGYEVKFAVDRGAVELYASQSETRLVVISAALGDPRRIIEAAAKAGALPTWIVTVEARSTQRLAASLAGLDRVAVTSTAGSPEDVLFLANELVFSKGARRREWRALYATPVAFRAEGSDSDEYGFSYDASPSGLYVRSLLPCATENVEVELRLPNRDERVRLHGKVARRFAFGSGAIASAPPGFSVKLDGPEEALLRWTDACVELIAQASSESLVPRPRTPSQPVLASPGLGGKEVPLAVPPATVSIESVVAPLPVALQAAIAEGTDVGELLSATLDEQTLTEVGTRPVTMDPETLGVREERPSEFMMSLPPQPTDSLPAPLEPTISAPPVAAGAPVPVPTAPAGPAARRALTANAAEREALGKMGTVLLQPEREAPPPPSVRSMDWESDAKTTVRSSQPSIEAPPPEAAKPDAAAPKPDAGPSPSPPAARAVPRPGAPPPPSATKAASPPAPAVTAKPSAPETESEPPLELDAGLLQTERPPPSTGDVAPTEPPPAPEAAPQPEPSKQEELRPAPAAAAMAMAHAGTVLAQPSIKQTLPMGMAKQDMPAAARRSSPEIPVARPSRKPTSEPPVAAGVPKRGKNRVLLFVAAAIGATGVGMGLALVTREPVATTPPTPVESAPTTATTLATAATAPTASAALAIAASASAGSAAAPGPSATISAAAAAPSASVAPAASEASGAPAAPSAATAASAATAPSAAPTPPPPPVPASTIDVNRLPRDRAALIVHSSASAHVFVHGTDYGSTNEMLLTSCGIRFVRLGRAMGDFIEAGQSYVIKCGKLTEITVEP